MNGSRISDVPGPYEVEELAWSPWFLLSLLNGQQTVLEVDAPDFEGANLFHSARSEIHHLCQDGILLGQLTQEQFQLLLSKHC